VSFLKRRYTKTLLFAFLQTIVFYGKAQNLILNGSFENNLCGNTSIIDCSNHKYDSLMLYSHGFGTEGNLDIINNQISCGAAEDGTWYLGMTSGGTDAFSLSLSSPILLGKTYSVSFNYRATTCDDPYGSPLKIGISTSDTTFGTLLYTAPYPPIPTNGDPWTQQSFSFTASINAQYLTVMCGGTVNVDSNWTHVDNFILDTVSNMMSIQHYIVNGTTGNLYPNPNNGSMTLDYNLKNDAVMEITDITGNLVATYVLPATETTMQVQNNNLQNGMYMYRIISNNAIIKQGKIVVMK
jgi:type IX secretion system substrate protein